MDYIDDVVMRVHVMPFLCRFERAVLSITCKTYFGLIMENDEDKLVLTMKQACCGLRNLRCVNEAISKYLQRAAYQSLFVKGTRPSRFGFHYVHEREGPAFVKIFPGLVYSLQNHDTSAVDMRRILDDYATRTKEACLRLVEVFNTEFKWRIYGPNANKDPVELIQSNIMKSKAVAIGKLLNKYEENMLADFIGDIVLANNKLAFKEELSMAVKNCCQVWFIRDTIPVEHRISDRTFMDGGGESELIRIRDALKERIEYCGLYARQRPYVRDPVVSGGLIHAVILLLVFRPMLSISFAEMKTRLETIYTVLLPKYCVRDIVLSYPDVDAISSNRYNRTTCPCRRLIDADCVRRTCISCCAITCRCSYKFN